MIIFCGMLMSWGRRNWHGILKHCSTFCTRDFFPKVEFYKNLTPKYAIFNARNLKMSLQKKVQYISQICFWKKVGNFLKIVGKPFSEMSRYGLRPKFHENLVVSYAIFKKVNVQSPLAQLSNDRCRPCRTACFFRSREPKLNKVKNFRGWYCTRTKWFKGD